MLHVELTALFIAVKFTIIPPPQVKLKCSNPCTALIHLRRKKSIYKFFFKKVQTKHTKYRNKVYSNLKQIVFLLRRRLWKLFPCLNELQATVAEMNHRKREIWLKHCKWARISPLLHPTLPTQPQQIRHTCI